METLFFLLAACVALLLAFVFGVLTGAKDCKRRFRIPYGAVEVDEYGEYVYD